MIAILLLYLVLKLYVLTMIKKTKRKGSETMSNRTRVVDLEPNEIYTYNKKDGFKTYDPMSFKYKGFDILSLYKHYTDKKDIIKKEKFAFELLKEFLLLNDVEIESDTLYSLVSEMVEKVKVFKHSGEYHYFKTNEEGYVVDHRHIEGGITDRKFEVPEDIAKGYYKLNNQGKIIKDENKEMELWKVY